MQLGIPHAKHGILLCTEDLHRVSAGVSGCNHLLTQTQQPPKKQPGVIIGPALRGALCNFQWQ